MLKFVMEAKKLKLFFGSVELDELELHGQLTRNRENWANFKQIMIAQAGALGLVAGSHMAETDGDTFSKLNTKLQSGLIQGVYEQLAVKVSLPCPDFYASFPTKLANLHLKLGGRTGELDDDEKLKRSKCITRLGKWNENFEKDVT